MIYAELPPTPVIECSECTAYEQQTLEFLQQRGITDQNALAVVLGNIQQESRFKPNICEGGAIVPYDQCLRGGYGLIQWTSINRYRGLGDFAAKYGGSPTSLSTQLRYMVNESQWTEYELYLKTYGHTIEYYMTHAYPWLGWGIHGNRTTYAYDYRSKFEVVINHANDIVPDQVLPSTRIQSRGDIRSSFGERQTST